MVNIFDSAKEKIMPGWAKFQVAGDGVQGTYVGKIVGQIDGYGNEQVIFQLLQEDGKIINVGFGLNKKFLLQDMDRVTFGQVVGFKYKGKLAIKDKFGKAIEVKDFALFQDPKIVNEKWLAENKDNMPTVTRVAAVVGTESEAGVDYDTFGAKDDVPFSSGDSLTAADKAKVAKVKKA